MLGILGEVMPKERPDCIQRDIPIQYFATTLTNKSLIVIRRDGADLIHVGAHIRRSVTTLAAGRALW